MYGASGLRGREQNGVERHPGGRMCTCGRYAYYRQINMMGPCGRSTPRAVISKSESFRLLCAV